LGLTLCLATAPAAFATPVKPSPIVVPATSDGSRVPDLRREIRASVRATLPTAHTQPAKRDSVKNGVIIGAVVGGVYGAVAAVISRDELSTSGTIGVVWTSAAVGAGIGWLIDWLK
jgi:uncharacterized protein YcfJ